jgi:hypothetical protein
MGSTGRKAMEVWMAKSQVQPELASGARRRPPAGIRFIQHPGRVEVVILE